MVKQAEFRHSAETKLWLKTRARTRSKTGIKNLDKKLGIGSHSEFTSQPKTGEQGCNQG